MLAGFRNFTRSWAAGLLIALLIGAFALFGITDFLSAPPTNAVASGKGVEIAATELQAAFRRQLEAVREQNPNVTQEEALRQDFHRSVLSQLIALASIDAAVDQIGLSGSDTTVAREIRTDPSFLNPVTRRFDREQYLQTLQNAGLTPAEYEEERRDFLARQQLLGVMEGVLRAPRPLALTAFDLATEQRLVTIAQIEPALLKDPGEPSQEQIEAFYKDKAGDYVAAERRTLTIAAVTDDLYLAGASVDQPTLDRLVEARLQAGATAETRSFVQVAAKSREAAEAAAARLARGEDPKAVAAAVGGEALEFTDVAKGDIPQAAVANAVFSRGEGETTGAIEGELAWVAARVLAVTPAQTPDRSTIEEEVRTQLAQELARERAQEAQQRLEESLRSGATLEAAAAEAGVELRTLEQVTARGTALGAVAPLWPADDLLKAAFQIEPGAVTDLQRIEGGYALARVEAVTPAGPLPLADVREDVVRRWVEQQVSAQASRLAEEVKAEALATGDLRKAAQARGLTLLPTERPLRRSDLSNAPDPSLLAALFGPKQGEIVIARGSSWIVKIEEVRRLSPEGDPALLENVALGVRRGLLQDIQQAFQSQAVSSANVQINEKLLQQLYPGAGSGEAEEGA